MSIKDLLTAIHNNNSLRLCKITPAAREDERKTIAEATERFLQAGKQIEILPSVFNSTKKESTK